MSDPMQATMDELRKFDATLAGFFDDEDALEKAFRDLLERCRAIAIADGEDWADVYFVEAWGDYEFEAADTDEKYEQLADLYEYIVVDGG